MAGRRHKVKVEPPTPEPDGRPLSADGFRRLEVQLDNPAIGSSGVMVWFNDRLVVGTGRVAHGGAEALTGPAEGGDVGSRPEIGGGGRNGVQIVTFDPSADEWELVYESPDVEDRDGHPRVRELGVSAGGVCRTARRSRGCLYLAVETIDNKVMFLRSPNGVDFEACKDSCFGGDGEVPSVRTIVDWRGKVYATPTGRTADCGIIDDIGGGLPVLFESTDPMSGKWRPVSEPAFGRDENLAIHEIAVFNDHLYAATLNARYGYEVWKTDGAGMPPYTWTLVLERGAYRGPASGLPTAMFAFNDALYVAGAVPRQGKAGRDRWGPLPAELVRVYADDSWDLVSGTMRCTPGGLKRPISGRSGGFGDRFTHAFWRMAAHAGHLYVGTAEWRWLPSYLDERDDLSDAQFDRLFEATSAYQDGAFGLWRSADGVEWEAVTTTGLPGSRSSNCGVGVMASSPYGLFVAPAPDPEAPCDGRLQLWWGSGGTDADQACGR